jgi:aconitate hydratase
MGILPLQLLPGESAQSLGLTGSEEYRITGMNSGLTPGMLLSVVAVNLSGLEKKFTVITRLYSNREVSMILAGGILPLLFKERVSFPQHNAAPAQINS